MLKIYLLAAVALLAGALGMNAQVVTTEPSPLQEDSQNVVVYFHADQGNMGLKDQPASTALYAHTGVSTIDGNGKVSDWQYVPATWNTNLPKCKLEYVSANLWKLNIGDIRTFYGVPADIRISKLCFVFRNANGTKEGKGTGNTDILVPVSDKGFQIAFTSSATDQVITATTCDVTFTLSSTKEANLSIAVNGTTVKNASSVKTLTAEYTFPGVGDYTVTATADDGSQTKTETISLCWAGASRPLPSAAAPAMGATRNADGSVTFCIAAPQKQNVMVIGSWNGYKASGTQVMNYIDEVIDGIPFRFFTVTLPENQIPRNTQVMYYYLVDNSIKVGDPYARLTLDPYNDKYISADVYPDLPEYPIDKLSGTPLAVFADNINDYEWQTKSFTAPDKTDLIIYELLVRDFTGTEGKALGDGTIRRAIEKIPYLKSLGVNAIELLPINEFNGNISWGYNPNFYFAIDKAYGTPQDYKEFIDKCHSEGIAVILDMVFNQSDGMHPWYMMYTPGSNPFYNVNAPHAYSVLNDWNQGYPLVERQWKDVVQYWLEEYKVDGFRFDLVKGLGNNDSYANSGESATNAFNQSRVDRMKRIHEYMKEVNPEAYFINENLADAKEENMMAEDGELNWANINNAGCQFAMGYSSESNLNRMWAIQDKRTAGSTVSYLESHDEQRLAYKQQQYGVTGVKGNKTASCQRLGAAAAQMILVPGSHMIWQFSEMGNSQNTKNANGSNNTDPKIVNWTLLDNPENKGLFESYQQLISLRLGNNDLFPSSASGIDFSIQCNISNWTNGRLITARNDNKELYCAINPNTSGTLDISVPFRTADNSAYEIYSQSHGCEASFNATTGKITVPANCYVVVASKTVSEVKEITPDSGYEAYVTGLAGKIIVTGATSPVRVYDINARLIAESEKTDFSVSAPSGIYIVKTGTKAVKVFVK